MSRSRPPIMVIDSTVSDELLNRYLISVGSLEHINADDDYADWLEACLADGDGIDVS